MKKIVSFFCIFVIICGLFISCSGALDSLSSSNVLSNVVINHIGDWETVDGKYCVILQLYELDGQYYLYCGYDETPAEHNNDAINRYTPSFAYRYVITETTFGKGEKTTFPSAAEVLNGQKNLLGTSLYYYSDTYEEKNKLIILLFDGVD